MPYQNCRTECIVLKNVDFGESDRIVTLYSPDRGRFAAIAKGAKRSQKRFVNKLEEFSLLDISFRPARHNNLHFLSEAELKEAFLTLRTHWQRYCVAMLANELVLRFTGEHDPDRRIFSLLHWLLESLHHGASPLPTAVFFHLHLLNASGYRPKLEHCAICSCLPAKNRKLSFALQPGNGTLICSRCSDNAGYSRFTLSLQSLKFLQTAQGMATRQVHRLQMPENVASECLYVLYSYSKYLLQCDIHSWSFLAHIRKKQSRDKTNL
ncbi:MAG: DNA repair protein RecO [Candidatus Electrothrix sp. GW3-4]|uniref:DNA repair protein RecO n=1 Tax=Candidatus Electrothrix sp. GW3-4 TaxID=3126740 RepID=UPI0030D214CB